jgi:hypothetical protein
MGKWSALGGTRTPNLLIRSPAQGVRGSPFPQVRDLHCPPKSVEIRPRCYTRCYILKINYPEVRVSGQIAPHLLQIGASGGGLAGLANSLIRESASTSWVVRPSSGTANANLSGSCSLASAGNVTGFLGPYS